MTRSGALGYEKYRQALSLSGHDHRAALITVPVILLEQWEIALSKEPKEEKQTLIQNKREAQEDTSIREDRSDWKQTAHRAENCCPH